LFRELEYQELKRIYDGKSFDIDKILGFDGLIGQEQAEKSIRFGLNIKRKDYNIFLVGQEGTGKTTFAQKLADEIAVTEEIPCDICYIYNFSNPKNAKALKLSAGTGKFLKKDMEDLIDILSRKVSQISNTADFETKKVGVMKEFQKERDYILKLITKEADKCGFGVETTATGIYFMPVTEDGDIISEEQYENLSDEEKGAINEISVSIQKKASEYLVRLREVEEKAKKSLNELEYSEYLFMVSFHVGVLINKHIDNNEIVSYLKDVKEDIIKNIELVMEDDNEAEENYFNMIPWYNKKNSSEQLNRYKINLLVDNSELKGAPVLIDYNPTFFNLVGGIEYNSEFGTINTDFMKIKSGNFHHANGGYLILRIQDILSQYNSWEVIKNVLKTGKISIDLSGDYSGSLVIGHILPEPIDVSVKIILTGSYYYFNLLSSFDEDFKDLFKITAEFDFEMNSDKNNTDKVVGYIKKFIEDEGKIDFSVDGILEVLNFSNRIAESQNKFTAKLNKIYEILIEATNWALSDNKNLIDREYVAKAINEKLLRTSFYSKKLDEQIHDEIILIETKGEKVGQINGLSVIEIDEYLFGKPSRITATTYVGESGVINIEDEAELSGEIHNKGFQVLIGYIGQKYSQNFPVSFTSRVCFEQNYGGIDGDSASSTELYAILSSLSGVPIKQEIAVTGSINQFGEIQPIGGVTSKIEGFFDVCAKRGLTGTQGVIIPKQNVADLVLKDEVIEAVKNKKFHIYSISHVDEGLEILTGIKAGKPNKNGEYGKNTLHYKVFEKLKHFHKINNPDKN